MTDADVARFERAAPSRLADAVAHVLHPVGVVLALLLLVGWRAGGVAGLAWGLLGWLLGSVLPFAVVLLLVRVGRLADAQVLRRSERGLPAAVGLTALVLGVGALLVLDAPRPVLALVVAQTLAFAVVGLATVWTKASVHAAVVAAGAAVLWLELGATALLAGVAATALVGWARVRRGRHSMGQVGLGSPSGSSSAPWSSADCADRQQRGPRGRALTLGRCLAVGRTTGRRAGRLRSSRACWSTRLSP